MVHGFKSHVRLCADNSEPAACFRFCVSLSLSAPPLLTLYLSVSLPLSKINTNILKKEEKSQVKSSGPGLSFLRYFKLLINLPTQYSSVHISIPHKLVFFSFYLLLSYLFFSIIYCQIGFHTTPSAYPNKCPPPCPSPTLLSP